LGTGKYFGLPFMIGKNRQATFFFKETTFGYIKDKLWHKINSWSNKCLSKAGRKVLIKYVL